MILNRRNLLKGTALALANPQMAFSGLREIHGGLEKLASSEYKNVSHSSLRWQEIQDGMYFARIDVLRDNELVDRLAMVKFNPNKNKVKVFNKYEGPNNCELLTVEEWQKETGASVMFNSAQYLAAPTYGAPIALVISDGRKKGILKNRHVKGMLVAEPIDKKSPLVDLLDFEYDRFDHSTMNYTQGVQHWPILLDRKGKIKVKPADWQANRTVIAKDRNGDMLVFVTEGGFFTLYSFGQFLKESPLNIHTAMNLDGGYEASMSIKTPNLRYETYGQYETYGPNNNVSIPKARIAIPGAIGVFPRR